MINLNSDVIKSALWVIPADGEDRWYSYFDWLSQFELTKKRHIQWSQKQGYSLFVDSCRLQTHNLLIVHFDKISPARFVDVWRSLGSPQTTFFSHRHNVDSYVTQQPGTFFRVKDIE